MTKFEEYKIETSEKNEKLVLNYLEKIKNFINNNSLDGDLYFDIEERVFEKLTVHKKLDQLKIKQILNEIGEPEDIFEMEESKANSDFFVFFRNMKNTSIKAVKKIFATGFNLNNLFIFVKTVLSNLFKFIKKSVINIFNFSISTIKYVFKNFSIITKNIFKLLKEVVFFIIKIAKKIFNIFGSIIGFTILGISILFLFFVPILYSGLEIGGINYTNFIPKEAIISYLFLNLAIAIIGVFFILKKKFLVHFIVFGISLVTFLSFGFMGGTKIYNDYSYEGKIYETYELETQKELIHFNKYDINLYGNLYFDDGLMYDFPYELKKSDNENLKINLITKVFTKDENSKKIIEKKLSKFNLQEVEGNIVFEVENGKTFTEDSDFTPINRKLEILIPENKIIDFGYTHNYYSRLMWNCESNKFGNINGEIVCVEKNR